jgi:hypothetical protein
MDERDLSELSFLARALIQSPARFEELVRVAMAQPAASEFSRAVASLRDAYRRQGSAAGPDWSAIVSRLRAEPEGGPAWMAGRALDWAFHSAQQHRKLALR